MELQDLFYISEAQPLHLMPLPRASKSMIWYCVYGQLLRHVWPFATPWTVAHQAPLSMGFPRQEYWSGLPCPPPGDLPVFRGFCTDRRILYHCHLESQVVCTLRPDSTGAITIAPYSTERDSKPCPQASSVLGLVLYCPLTQNSFYIVKVKIRSRDGRLLQSLTNLLPAPWQESLWHCSKGLTSLGLFCGLLYWLEWNWDFFLN